EQLAEPDNTTTGARGKRLPRLGHGGSVLCGAGISPALGKLQAGSLHHKNGHRPIPADRLYRVQDLLDGSEGREKSGLGCDPRTAPALSASEDAGTSWYVAEHPDGPASTHPLPAPLMLSYTETNGKPSGRWGQAT